MEMRERRPGEGTGQCCYETREEDGKRNDQSEGDGEEGVRKVGLEGRLHSQIYTGCWTAIPPGAYPRRF